MLNNIINEFLDKVRECGVDVSYSDKDIEKSMGNSHMWDMLETFIIYCSYCIDIYKCKYDNVVESMNSCPTETQYKVDIYDNLLESLKDNNHTECLDYYTSCVDVNSIITKLDDYKEICRVCHNNDIDPDCLDSELESLKDAKREIISDLEDIINNYS